MPYKSIRTLGATVVLVGVAVAALLQMGPFGDPDAIAALLPEERITSTVPSSIETEAAEETSTTTTAPFTYRLGVLAGVSTDNFWAFYGAQPSVWNSYILGPTKPALFKVDPSSSELVPELAMSSSTPVREQGRWVVDLELRDDLAWSDGEQITAEDIAFTFRTVRELGLGGSWAASFPESIVSVEASSVNGLRIEFADQPTFAVWPNAIGTAPVMPEHAWREIVEGATMEDLYAASGSADPGGGPLVLTDVSDEMIVSQANPGYPLETPPATVVYQIFEAEDEAVEALTRGEIDAILTPNGLSEDSRRRVESEQSISVEVNPANGVRYLGFNLEREPMSDGAFRTALALLLDRERLVGELSASSEVAYSFVREANSVWYDRDAASTIEDMYRGDLDDRVARAIDGLRQAGYSWDSDPSVTEDGSITAGEGLRIDGQSPAPLTILTAGDSYDPTRPAYVEQIAAALALLGFDARPVVTDFDTVVDLTFSEPGDEARQYDMYFLGWTLGNPSLPDYYRPLFASDGVMNNTGYANPAFDEALGAYERSRTLDEARSHLWAMEEILVRDLPYLLLYNTEITEAYRSDRVVFGIDGSIGGIQGRLGGLGDVDRAGPTATLGG